jgi:hypothetical protein
MPRKKKRPNEMTNEELARFVFPKKVVEEAKKIAHKDEDEKAKKIAHKDEDEKAKKERG